MKFQKLLLKSLALAISISFAASQTLFAGTSVVSGTIQKIVSAGGGQYELIVEDEKGLSKYLVDSSTLVQAIVPANKVSVGSEVLVAPKGGIKENGMESPFKNMPPAVREALGLPNIPSVPSTPQIPKVPQIPQVPKTPKIPQMPQGMPQIPQIPQVPKIPGKTQPPAAGSKAVPPVSEAPQPPAPTEEGAASQQGAAPSGMVPSPQPGPAPEDAETKAKEKVEEVPQPPLEARSSVQDPNLISKATPTMQKIKGKEVLDVAQTNEGIALELVSPAGKVQSVTLAPSDKVLQILDIKDLKQNMTVELEVVSDNQDQFVQRVTIT